MKKLKLSLQHIEGAEVLTREQLKMVTGGETGSTAMSTWCRKRSENVEDRRPGQVADPGFLNANGCWVYSGMNGNAHPGCGPSDPNWTYLNALIGGDC